MFITKLYSLQNFSLGFFSAIRKISQLSAVILRNVFLKTVHHRPRRVRESAMCKRFSLLLQKI